MYTASIDLVKTELITNMAAANIAQKQVKRLVKLYSPLNILGKSTFLLRFDVRLLHLVQRAPIVGGALHLIENSRMARIRTPTSNVLFCNA